MASDVIVFLAPTRSRACNRLLRAIADIKSNGRAAVLVVFTREVDDAVRQRFLTAGADLCVVAPPADDLFGPIQRARALHEARVAARARTDDHLLDALWLRRSQPA
jgi:hypothetical protein